MTREEAIDILKHDISADKQGIVYCHDEVGIEALEMAIKALEQESTPTDDYFRKMAEVVISQLRADRDRLEDKLAELEQEPSVEELQKRSYLEGFHEALKMAVCCEDAISRQSVLEWIQQSLSKYGSTYTTDMLNMWGLFEEQIKTFPPVNPKSDVQKLYEQMKGEAE